MRVHRVTGSAGAVCVVVFLGLAGGGLGAPGEVVASEDNAFVVAHFWGSLWCCGVGFCSVVMFYCKLVVGGWYREESPGVSKCIDVGAVMGLFHVVPLLSLFVL